MEIPALVTEGCRNKKIASKLFFSTDTVRTHLMHIYEKLYIHCRFEAATKYTVVDGVLDGESFSDTRNSFFCNDKIYEKYESIGNPKALLMDYLWI